MRRARRERVRAGFTLAEMMVVVAIIGVLIVAAYSLLKGRPRAIDGAEQCAAKLSEAARKAVAGGAVRANVAAFNGVTARTRVIFEIGTPTVISTERLVEDPSPSSTSASWVEFSRVALPRDVQVVGWREVPTLDPTAGPEHTTDATIYCEPDGRCTGRIVYLQAGRTQARVIVLPLGGAPVTFASW